MARHFSLHSKIQPGERIAHVWTARNSSWSRLLSLATAVGLLTAGITVTNAPDNANASTIETITSSFTVTEKTQSWIPSRVVNGVVVPSKFEDVFTEIAIIEIQHPNQVLCTSSTCTLNYSYRYAPIGASWDAYNFNLVNLTTGSSSSLGYFSKSTNWINRQHFFTPSAGQNSFFEIRISGLLSNETEESNNPSILFVSSKTMDLFFLNPDLGATATSLRTGKVYYANKFKVFEYGFPTRVNVSSQCMSIPVAVAAVDLASGYKDNTQIWAQSSLFVSIQDRRGRELARTTLLPNSSDWSTKVVDDKLHVEVCGLVDERKKERKYRFQARFSTTQYGITASIDLRQNAVFRGVTKYTTINCLRGDRVRVVRSAAPVCPENFEETDLRVANGKLVQTTIKCLRGVDVINVTAPEPSCPGGFTRTTLPTKNGKIKSTITCVKGLNAIKVRDFSPKCPVGFKKFEDS